MRNRDPIKWENIVPVVNQIVEFNSFINFKHHVKLEHVVPDGTCGKPKKERAVETDHQF